MFFITIIGIDMNTSTPPLWAVDREFFHIFLALGGPLGCLWLPVSRRGLSLAPFLAPLASLGSLQAQFGMHVGPLGVLGAPFPIFLKKWTAFSGKSCQNHWFLQHLVASRNSAPASPGKPRISPKWNTSRLSQPHFSRRGLG